MDQLVNEQTLVLIKPDGVKRGLIGTFTSCFEDVGLKLIGLKMLTPTIEQAKSHYPTNKEEWVKGIGFKTLQNFKEQNIDILKYHSSEDPLIIGKEVIEKLIKYLVSGPIYAQVWQGPHAVEVIRKLRGSTAPIQASPGTLLAKYSFDSQVFANQIGRITLHNLIHASGTVEEAKDEILLWFKQDELVTDYTRSSDKVML